MAPSDAQTDRKAALLLHALTPADQVRVLQRLDEPARDHLQALLSELGALGIPKGRQWVPVEEVDAVQNPPALDTRQFLHRASSDAVMQALAGQSVDTVATVLLCERWSWASALIERWPADQRTKLRALVQAGGQVPSALADQLLAVLAEQLQRHPPAAVARARQPSRSAWYARLWSSIAS